MGSDGGGPLLLALWLTEHARNQFLFVSPPTFGTVHADHLTLHYLPSDDKLPTEDSTWMVGDVMSIDVLPAVSDAVVQAAPALVRDDVLECCQNEHPHITISVGPGGTAAMSEAMLQTAKGQASCQDDPLSPLLNLKVVVGLTVKTSLSEAKKVLIT